MSVYIVASIAIHDREEYSQYESGFMSVFEKFDGEVLAVSDEPAVLEGEWPYTRAVVIRFPSSEEARRWYSSAEYQEIVQHRLRASTASIIALEGLG